MVAVLLYRMQGGMKAVLWADTMQFFIMVSGLAAILIQGTIKLGGIANIWKICEQGGRINFFEYLFNLVFSCTLCVALCKPVARISLYSCVAPIILQGDPPLSSRPLLRLNQGSRGHPKNLLVLRCWFENWFLVNVDLAGLPL